MAGRFRFSLRMLFLATTFVALGLGLCAVVVRWHLANQRDHAGQLAISTFGGVYSMESAVQARREGTMPNWLWRTLFNRVYQVDISCDSWPLKEVPPRRRFTVISDTSLADLHRFSGLRELDLHGTNISDDGVEYLQTLRDLKLLDISDTRITRDGVEKLREALPTCEIKH